MTPVELAWLFRSDVVDVALPHLWSDRELFGYMNDACFMFVRLTGGISDFTSKATQVDISAGEPTSVLHPSVLRIMDARRLSDSREIIIVNSPDALESGGAGGSGYAKRAFSGGPVDYLMIGAQRNLVRWGPIPTADDVAQLTIYRLPLDPITKDSSNIPDIGEEHHIHLLHWMKHLAYQKQDAETFNRAVSSENGGMFRDYCAHSRAEAERYKHKTRIVEYGGI